MALGRKTGGRQKGSQNKFTRSVKDAVKATFDALQEDQEASLTAWAKDNLTEFYKLAGKLIPAAVDANISGSVEFKRIERVIVDPKN